MNTSTKILIALALLIGYAFYTAVDVFAMDNNTAAVNNIKEQDLNPQPKTKPAQSCDNWKNNGWIVELGYYIDGDTPTETAYNDYLEDYHWYFEQYPGTCKPAPETMN